MAPISGEDCSLILPVIPVFIGMLRKSNKKAGDLFLQQADADDVESLLEQLREDVAIEGSFTITQMRFNLETYDHEVWADSIKNVLQGCSSGLVPGDVMQSLTEAYNSQEKEVKSSPKSCGAVLGPILDDLPRVNFQVLGEFCALIRDTASDTSKVSKALSKDILGHDSPALFSVLVEQAEPLFGRAGAIRKVGK